MKEKSFNYSFLPNHDRNLKTYLVYIMIATAVFVFLYKNIFKIPGAIKRYGLIISYIETVNEEEVSFIRR
jgi:hypothetical protein